MGFEPTTSSMPSRRAPNCATAPPGRTFLMLTSRRSLRLLASEVLRTNLSSNDFNEVSHERNALVFSRDDCGSGVVDAYLFEPLRPDGAGCQNGNAEICGGSPAARLRWRALH